VEEEEEEDEDEEEEEEEEIWWRACAQRLIRIERVHSVLRVVLKNRIQILPVLYLLIFSVIVLDTNKSKF